MKVPISILSLMLLLSFLIIPQFGHSSSTLTITVMTDKERYNLGEDVYINGTLTIMEIPVPNGLVAVQVDYPSPHGRCTLRTRPTGYVSSSFWDVEILQLYPSDQSGNPKSSFERGKRAFFTVEWQNNDDISHYVIVALDLYDVNNVPFVTTTPYEGWLDPGEPRNGTVEIPLPTETPTGQATVYANLLSGLPKNGGFAYCPEELAKFDITDGSGGGAGVSESQIVTSTTTEGTYNLTFHLPTTGGRRGTYTVYVSCDYAGQQTSDTTTFYVILFGDVNGDGVVDGSDVVLVIEAIPSFPGHPNWNPDADVNEDDLVDGTDYVLVIEHVGTHI